MKNISLLRQAELFHNGLSIKGHIVRQMIERVAEKTRRHQIRRHLVTNHDADLRPNRIKRLVAFSQN